MRLWRYLGAWAGYFLAPLAHDQQGFLGKAAVWQAPVKVVFHAGPNAAILTTPNVTLFNSDGDYEVESVSEIHETLGTDGGAVTLDVVKCTGTQAAAAGATVLLTTFNLKATINTLVTKARALATLAASRPATQLTKGDRLALKFTGVFTALTGVCVTVVLVPFRRRPSW